MADSRAIELFKQQETLENNRSVLDGHLREVAERVLPRQDHFQRDVVNEGEKRTEKIFDSTALLALDRAASAVDSLVTPSTQVYQKLDPEEDGLVDDLEVRVFLDELNRCIFRMRYRPRANFSHQTHECFVGLMAFGTLGMFIDDEVGVGARYKSISLANMWIAESASGFVDLVHRKMRLQARQAVQKFGLKALPEKMRNAYEKNPFEKFDFLHCVSPNQEIKTNARDYRGMPFKSYYASYEGKAIVSEGGFRSFPYAVSRHVTAPNETYGRSPAMLVLPDIKMVNEMEKTTIRAAHKVVSPPLLAYGDGILSQFSTRPDAINYGGVNEQGHQLVVPLKTGANLPIVLEMSEQKRKVINDAFYVTLFQILVQNPQMTATEALIRAQEKGQLLAPTVGRQQSEFLGTCTEREIEMMQSNGVIEAIVMSNPVAMRGYKKLVAKGAGRIKTTYTSPLTRLRRAEDGVAIMRQLEFMERIAAAKQDPSVFDAWDVDAAVQEMAIINGTPAKLMRTREVIEQIRAGREQAAMQAAEAQQAEQGAKTVQHLAKAASLAPQPQQGTEVLQ